MKFFKTLLVGFVTGAAATYFLNTEEGKKTKAKVMKTLDDYKADPDSYHQLVKEKANDYKNLAEETLKDYKDKFESGQLSGDDILASVKDKAKEVADLASASFTEVVDNVTDLSESQDLTTTQAEVDDIVIDYSEAISEEGQVFPAKN